MNFFQDLVSDKLGHASSKRMMSFVAFLLIVQAVQMNLFKGTVMDSNLMNILVICVLGLSGASTVENMSTKTPDSKKKEVAQTVTTTKEETTHP